jgi:hypothetical protein
MFRGIVTCRFIVTFVTVPPTKYNIGISVIRTSRFNDISGIC